MSNPFKNYLIDDNGNIDVNQGLAMQYFAYEIQTAQARPDGSGGFFVPVAVVNEVFPDDPIVTSPGLPPPPPPPTVIPPGAPPAKLPHTPPPRTPPPPGQPPGPGSPPGPPGPPGGPGNGPPGLPPPDIGPIAPPPPGPSLSDNLQLLKSIEALLVDGEDSISLPLTAINQGIAKLSALSSKTILKLQADLLKYLDLGNVDSENDLDALSVAILRPIQDWQLENNLLLTQLAAGAGLTQPGDPLEQALVNQVAQEPELALSATLLIALRDFGGKVDSLVEVLREIRDRMPQFPVHVQGEPEAIAPAEQLPMPGLGYLWNVGNTEG